MKTVVVASPCYRIHRFVQPPFAKHVIHHEFIGGGCVLIGILGRLCGAGKAQSRRWQSAAEAIPRSGLPERFIRLAPFAPTPAQRERLKPNSEFLRVKDKDDDDEFAKHTQRSFRLRGEKGTIYVVGGTSAEEAWHAMGSRTVPGAGDTVYIIAHSADAIAHHCDYLKNLSSAATIVGQIDLRNLANDYPIQADTSYDRTVGEICRASRPGKPTKLMEDLVGEQALSHLIIRVGSAACIVASVTSAPLSSPVPRNDHNDKSRWEVVLYHHPERCAHTTFPGLGSMLSNDLVLMAAMVRQLAVQPSDSRAMAGAIELGARVGVQATYRCFLEGFGLLEDRRENIRDLSVKPAVELFARFIDHGLAVEGLGGKFSTIPNYDEPPPLKVVPRKVNYELASSPNKFWRMVIHDFTLDAQKAFSPQSSAWCFTRAHSYLLDEPGAAPLPIVRIGKLKLVDRHEVEDYLFLQRLLLDYHADAGLRRPLCIGVFGQPGAGKSYGVTELVAEMSGDNRSFAKEAITINLSQLRAMEELVESFHRIRDACLKTPIPLVFFDEFDAGYAGKTFGWLNAFLAPMQSGEFEDRGKTYHFGKAIFVFAGGVNHSFWEFNERSRYPEFCHAKGPDFISRLRGVLNIKGMNVPEGEEVEHIYMLRRAVFLKDILKGRLGEPKPLIQRELAQAFLKIPQFKHGVRSMQAIIEMSSFRKHETYCHGHLPPRDQLEMHVDARSFLALAGVETPGAK